MLAQPTGLLGWSTSKLIGYDQLAPGVIRRVLSSGPAHRQAVFALLASEVACERHQQITGTEPTGAQALRRAEIIRDGDAKEVLVELLGREPPDGLRGGLERVGLSPMKAPSLYARLIEVYTSAQQRPLAAVLRHVGQITPTMLRVADVLPSVLLHPAVITRLESLAEAGQLVEALNFARAVNSRMSDEVLAGALSRMSEDAGLDDVLARFVRRADLPLGEPLPASDEVVPLRSVRDMVMASREFRNCLGQDRKVRVALLGRASYAVLHGEAVMEFVRLSTGGWLFVDVHGPRNAPVPDEVREMAKAKCVAAGVPFVTKGLGRDGRFGQFYDPFDPQWLDLAA